MPDEAATTYFFDGSGGCDLCDAHTGYYPDPVDPPHPGCNCPVEEIATDEDDIDLRNLQLEETSDEIEFTLTVHNCDSDEAGEASEEIDEEEDDQLDDDLREFAEAHGWSPPDSDHLAFNVAIGPQTEATITLRVERYSVWMEAEMWTTRPDGTEAAVGLMFGSYEKNVRIVDAESEATECAEPEPDAGAAPDVDLKPGDVII
jgi:hypothetical protein